MPKRKTALDDLWEIGKASPKAAVVAASVLAFFAALGDRLLPPLVGAFAPFLWLFVFALGLGAVAGVIKQRARAQRFGSQRTVEDLQNMNWRQFEFLVADAFKHRGYKVIEGSGYRDGGVDLVLIDSTGRETLVQCKQHRTRNVGEPKVREFYGAMAAKGPDTPGIFVTCGRFTEDANRFAKGKSLWLVDGPQLTRIIRAANGAESGAEETSQRNDAVPECPRCGRGMVVKVARRGSNAGGEFWSCAAFPDCRGSRSINRPS